MLTPIFTAAIIFGAFVALPASWGVRALAAAGILAACFRFLTAVTPFQNEGPLDGLADAAAIWVLVIAALGVGARVFWALANARSLQLAPPAASMLFRADCLLAGGAGIAAGSIATLLLAVAMRGEAGGLSVHLGIAALAALSALAAVRLRGRVRPMAVTALATLAVLTLAGGTHYPSLIQAKAGIIQPGAPRCLRTPQGTAPSLDQLRLLTLPLAQPRRPNLVLTVMTRHGQEDFRWSYRSFAFRTFGSYNGGPCPS